MSSRFVAHAGQGVAAGALALALGLGLVAPASAQTAPAQQPAQTQAQPAQPDAGGAPQPSNWIKVCETDPNTQKEACLVTQELRGPDGRFVGSAGVRELQDETKAKVLLVALPLGMRLSPGIRAQIDQNEQIAGEYAICIPTGCFAEAEVNDAFVGTMKKGNQLVVAAITGRGKQVGFPFSLSGFTKAWDGPPVDPQELADSQRKLEEEIRRRAEEQRRKLIEQGQAAPQGEAAPAAQAPAPAAR